MMRCPECHTELQMGLAPYSSDDGSTYIQVWTCPNAARHGKLVLCANDCGVLVPNPRYHYSYTPGLLGSGRWCCFPKCVIERDLLPMGSA